MCIFFLTQFVRVFLAVRVRFSEPVDHIAPLAEYRESEFTVAWPGTPAGRRPAGRSGHASIRPASAIADLAPFAQFAPASGESPDSGRRAARLPSRPGGPVGR